MRYQRPSDHRPSDLSKRMPRHQGHGAAALHVPMRATALMKYEQAEGAHFKIYHWHASPAR
ncbi:MAG: hypothetical protein ACI90M_002797 [Candidatus Azotimanducaceae bacterium]|jgi:hypothetical protein